jgi:hypothetical protein
MRMSEDEQVVYNKLKNSLTALQLRSVTEMIDHCAFSMMLSQMKHKQDAELISWLLKKEKNNVK